MKKVLAINAAANWLALAVTLITGFLLTPFILRHLGDAAFGLWVLMASFGGYYGLLDLGTRSAVLRYVAGFAAVNDSENLNAAVSTALTFYSIVGVFVLAVTAVVAATFDTLFHIDPSLVPSARALVVIFGVGVALEFPFAVFGSILEGVQKFARVAAIQIAAAGLRTGLIVAALLNGGGVVAIAAITVVTNLASAVARALAARRSIPDLRIRWGWSSRQARALGSFGLVTFWIAMAQNLRFQSDAVVIGSLMAVQSITMFSVASKLVQYYTEGVQAMAGVFTPVFSHLDARGEQDSLRKTLVLANLSSSLVAFPFGCLLFVAGGSVIRVWVGPDYASSAVLLQVLAIPTMLYLAQAGTPKVLYGMGRHVTLAKVLLLEGIANLVLSIALIGPFGLLGVAWGTAIPLMATSVLFLPVHVCRSVGLSLREYLREAHLIPLVLTVPFALVLVSLDYALVPTSYPAIALEMVVALGVYALTLVIYFGRREAGRTGLMPLHDTDPPHRHS